MINTTRAFDIPSARTRALPVGAPLPGAEPVDILVNIGEVMHRCLYAFVDAAVAAYPALGEHADLVKYEINTHPGTVAVWHTVYARKL